MRKITAALKHKKTSSKDVVGRGLKTPIFAGGDYDTIMFSDMVVNRGIDGNRSHEVSRDHNVLDMERILATYRCPSSLTFGARQTGKAGLYADIVAVQLKKALDWIGDLGGRNIPDDTGDKTVLASFQEIGLEIVQYSDVHSCSIYTLQEKGAVNVASGWRFTDCLRVINNIISEDLGGLVRDNLYNPHLMILLETMFKSCPNALPSALARVILETGNSLVNLNGVHVKQYLHLLITIVRYLGDLKNNGKWYGDSKELMTILYNDVMNHPIASRILDEIASNALINLLTTIPHQAFMELMSSTNYEDCLFEFPTIENETVKIANISKTGEAGMDIIAKIAIVAKHIITPRRFANRKFGLIGAYDDKGKMIATMIYGIIERKTSKDIVIIPLSSVIEIKPKAGKKIKKVFLNEVIPHLKGEFRRVYVKKEINLSFKLRIPSSDRIYPKSDAYKVLIIE